MTEPLVVAAGADLRVDLVANLPPPIDRGLVTRVLRHLHAAVEGDPAHHLRMREVPARPAYFPNPLVGLVPALVERVQQQEHERPRICSEPRARPDRLPERVGELAIDVQLELRM